MTDNVHHLEGVISSNGYGTAHPPPPRGNAVERLGGTASQLAQGFFALSLAVSAGNFAVRRFAQAWRNQKG